jgi:hypothetical protein
MEREFSPVLYRTLKDGGCTYSLVEDRILEKGERSYVMSIYPKKEFKIPLKDFNIYKLNQYVINNIGLLTQAGHVLGTWVHEEEVYLDVSVLFSKDSYLLEDLQLMSNHGQIAAWDLETSTLIPFDYDTKETFD